MEGGGRPADSLRFAEIMVETGEALCRDAERLFTEMLTGSSPYPTASESISGRSTTAI